MIVITEFDCNSKQLSLRQLILATKQTKPFLNKNQVHCDTKMTICNSPFLLRSDFDELQVTDVQNESVLYISRFECLRTLEDLSSKEWEKIDYFFVICSKICFNRLSKLLL